MDNELAEAIQAALKCKRAASLRLVASSCRPATSGNGQDVHRSVHIRRPLTRPTVSKIASRFTANSSVTQAQRCKLGELAKRAGRGVRGVGLPSRGRGR